MNPLRELGSAYQRQFERLQTRPPRTKRKVRDVFIPTVYWALRKIPILSLGGPKRRPRPERRCRFETLENRQLMAIAPIAPLADKSALLIPTGATPVHFFWDYRDSVFDDELGYFFVDGPDGRITKRTGNDPDGDPVLSPSGDPEYLRPGSPEYAQAALAPGNLRVVFPSGIVPDRGKLDKTIEVLGDHYIAFFVVQGTTTQAWRSANAGSKPNVWFSIGDANADGYEHFQLTSPRDPFYRSGILQYKVEDSNIALAKKRVSNNDVDLNDVVFSINIVPYATSDDYSVFNSGADYSGSPQGFNLNYAEGLLWNDYLPSNPKTKPILTHITLDDGDTWLPVLGRTRFDNLAKLHGVLTVSPNGSLDFRPDPNDPYWKTTPIDVGGDPDPIEFGYRITDRIDNATAFVTITHGFYQKGGPVDNRHTGERVYLLAGGGSSAPFDEARKKFFQQGSKGGDILLIAQGTEQKEFVNDVFDFYAGGRSRSVTSLNITTRDQANDPRLLRYVNGADTIWLGGGAQSLYQSTWVGTLLFAALMRAAASNVAVGGTSAGMAILGEAAYIDLPWDSVKSRFATLDPLSNRLKINYQGTQLPFASLSAAPGSPLHNYITDTHFSSRDRMGRLIAFAGKSHNNGLGVDEDTALFIEKKDGKWSWTVAGDGHVYLVSTSYSRTRPRFEDGSRLTFGPVDIYRLGTGTVFVKDVFQGSATYRVLVSKGTVYTTENGGSLY